MTKKKSEKPTPKKGLLPSVELSIIVVFVLSFLVWAVSQCQKTQATLQAEAQKMTQSDTIRTSTPPPYPQPSVKPSTAAPAIAADSTAPILPALIKDFTKLYITIDKLNMRTSPNLQGEVLMQLPLYEEVIFLNEVTDSTERINLGKVIADEPWVKIKHPKGQVGWVYGAGVHYYPRKHPGVIE